MVNGCWTFGFLIFITIERNSLDNSLYILTERSLKHPCSTRGLGPGVFLSLSPSLRQFSGAWKPAELTLMPWLSRSPQEGALCLREWCKPCSRVFLVLCLNQGILASFSLSLSYRRLWTTRFLSIKGPQHTTDGGFPATA